MSQLCAQSIKRLCQDYKWWSFDLIKETNPLYTYTRQVPMIEGFVDTKSIHVESGKSYGLSAASYDCRVVEAINLDPQEACLVHTVERFCIPDNVCGYVLDKSTYARVFVTLLNTLFDPGFSGIKEGQTLEETKDPYASGVLEVINLGKYPISIPAGSPICQFAFHWLDKKTDRPYRGKYSGQKGAQAAIFETTR